MEPPAVVRAACRSTRTRSTSRRASAARRAATKAGRSPAASGWAATSSCFRRSPRRARRSSRSTRVSPAATASSCRAGSCRTGPSTPASFTVDAVQPRAKLEWIANAQYQGANNGRRLNAYTQVNLGVSRALARGTLTAFVSNLTNVDAGIFLTTQYAYRLPLVGGGYAVQPANPLTPRTFTVQYSVRTKPRRRRARRNAARAAEARGMTVFDHVDLRVADVARCRPFYDALLARVRFPRQAQPDGAQLYYRLEDRQVREVIVVSARAGSSPQRDAAGVRRRDARRRRPHRRGRARRRRAGVRTAARVPGVHRVVLRGVLRRPRRQPAGDRLPRRTPARCARL